MKYITSFRTSRLTNAAHNEYMNLVVAICNANTKVLEEANSQVLSLVNALETETKNYKLSTASNFTKLISQNDTNRDRLYSALKRVIISYSCTNIESKSEAGETLKILLNRYNIKTKTQLDKQTSELSNLIDDLHSSDYSSLIEELNLTALVSDLEEANTNVHNYLLERNAEKSSVEAGILKACRAETDSAYLELVQFVDSLAVINGTDDYQDFINRINELINRYKLNVITKSSNVQIGLPDEISEEDIV